MLTQLQLCHLEGESFEDRAVALAVRVHRKDGDLHAPPRVEPGDLELGGGLARRVGDELSCLQVRDLHVEQLLEAAVEAGRALDHQGLRRLVHHGAVHRRLGGTCGLAREAGS